MTSCKYGPKGGSLFFDTVYERLKKLKVTKGEQVIKFSNMHDVIYELLLKEKRLEAYQVMLHTKFH